MSKRFSWCYFARSPARADPRCQSCLSTIREFRKLGRRSRRAPRRRGVRSHHQSRKPRRPIRHGSSAGVRGRRDCGSGHVSEVAGTTLAPQREGSAGGRSVRGGEDSTRASTEARVRSRDRVGTGRCDAARRPRRIVVTTAAGAERLGAHLPATTRVLVLGSTPIRLTELVARSALRRPARAAYGGRSVARRGARGGGASRRTLLDSVALAIRPLGERLTKVARRRGGFGRHDGGPSQRPAARVARFSEVRRQAPGARLAAIADE